MKKRPSATNYCPLSEADINKMSKFYWGRWSDYKNRVEQGGRVTPVSQQVWEWMFPWFIALSQKHKEILDNDRGT